MARNLNAFDAGGIVASGAGLTVSAAQFNAFDLGGIAARLIGSAVLHVTDSERLSAFDMGGIAARARAPAYVMFS
jgi:hypothetical protein